MIIRKLKYRGIIFQIIISFTMLYVISCSPHVDQADLYGKYEADYNIAKETIVLKMDGTYVQEVMLKSTFKVNRSEGKWTYYYDGEFICFVNNFMLVVDRLCNFNANYAKTNNKNEVSKGVQSYYGTINIGLAPDCVIYEKTP